MKKYFTCLLAALGLTTACAQQNFENTDVQGFAELTVEEYTEGHLDKAINIDQAKSDFVENVRAAIPTEKKIAIYCRSGRRSANAAGRLATEGYQCVNLKGGILAWKEAGKPILPFDK